MTAPIVVVAAVVEEDGLFLVAKRLRDTHLAGLWEFPGGKVQPGETHEGALQREIREELQTTIGDLRKIFLTVHAYAERTVELHFYRGTLGGAPQPALGQELRWIRREDFGALEFPPADAELIARLVAHDRMNGS